MAAESIPKGTKDKGNCTPTAQHGLAKAFTHSDVTFEVNIQWPFTSSIIHRSKRTP